MGKLHDRMDRELRIRGYAENMRKSYLLRVDEAVHLQPAHIDSGRTMIRVEQGKGRKDRYVMLSESAAANIPSPATVHPKYQRGSGIMRPRLMSDLTSSAPVRTVRQTRIRPVVHRLVDARPASNVSSWLEGLR